MVIKKLFTIIMLTIIFGMTTLSFITPPEDYFFYENRSRSVLPAPTVSSTLDGSFAAAFEDGLADRLFMRQSIIKLKTAADMLLLRRPVTAGQLVSDAMGEGSAYERVLLDFHGYYSWDTSYMTAAAAERAAELAALADAAGEWGGRFYYVGVPQQFSYFADAYPAWADDREWNVGAMRRAFADALDTAGVSFIDGGAALADAGHKPEFYASADHHYTLRGAAVVTDCLLSRIGEDTGVPMYYSDSFIFEALPNPVLGSRSRKLFGLWRAPERAEVAYPADHIPFTRTDDGAEVEPTVYALPATEEEYVLYGVYMGGDVAETVIETNRPWLPDLLVYGDSFTNAAECLLWASFDETRSVDTRYYTEATLEEYIRKHQPDVVVCVRDETVFLVNSY